MGKAHQEPHAKTTNSIAAPCQYPGEGVSADQLEAGCPGRIPTTKGLPTTKRYRYCSFWIDHYSKFIFPTFHETKAAAELIASKQAFQDFAARYQIKIKKIRADNGVYSSGPFQVSCAEHQQDLSFCAVGGHWQNGVAERFIGVITQMARTILLHAVTQWPSVLSEEFWPYAIRHACTFHNSSINPETNMSPHHMFTGSPAPWRMKDFRVFGCPVFVLDKRLQDGDSLPKWKSRCWPGVYVGQSLQHAGNVPLIYNPATTHVTPQYHLMFDDQFTTVTGVTAKLSDADYARLYQSTEWLHPNAFQDVADLYYFESFWSAPPSLNKPIRNRHGARHKQHRNSRPLPTIPTSEVPQLSVNGDSAIAGPIEDVATIVDTGLPADAGIQADARILPDADIRVDAGVPADAPISGQHNQSPKPYINLQSIACSAAFRSYQQQNGCCATIYTAHTSATHFQANPDPTISEDTNLFCYFTDADNMRSISLTESDNKTDILTQGQMFKAPDSSKFVKCQVDEIASLTELDIMDAFPLCKLPPQARLLSSIWSYRHKRLPNGVFTKYKSRLCVNGREQAFGRDYWETYAPVATWPTIRLLLYLSSVLNLETRQVDYTSAFPQAELDIPVYMRVPQGWYVDAHGKLAQHDDPKHNDKDHFLCLKKNLYGCKQAARNWFKMLSAGLRREGFVQSTTDTCLFLRHDCIIVVYVDDCLFFAPQRSTIDAAITSLSKIFKLKDEGDVSAFLGVQIAKDPKAKTITFTQTGLIDQIIRDVSITATSKGKDTPVDSILHPDTDGPPRTEDWNYRSIIGKLNYLANNTRPDISMAVHQCARFCVNPKALHELAVKRIVRYLLATRTFGLSLRPSRSFALDMYVDADFAGRWHKEFSHLRDSVLSRTGYVVTFCGCPISWASKLQSEIALSTTESEYIALSTATRELLPLRQILQDIMQHSFIKLPSPTHDSIATTTFQSNLGPSLVFEDNSACIVLATKETQFKPRTKHISLKYHHFHDQIQNGNLKIIKVASSENWADIFTKPLGRIKFEYLRKCLMGW
jgi:hypothetical protein